MSQPEAAADQREVQSASCRPRRHRAKAAESRARFRRRNGPLTAAGFAYTGDARRLRMPSALSAPCGTLQQPVRCEHSSAQAHYESGDEPPKYPQQTEAHCVVALVWRSSVVILKGHEWGLGVRS